MLIIAAESSLGGKPGEVAMTQGPQENLGKVLSGWPQLPGWTPGWVFTVAGTTVTPKQGKAG